MGGVSEVSTSEVTCSEPPRDRLAFPASQEVQKGCSRPTSVPVRIVKGPDKVRQPIFQFHKSTCSPRASLLQNRRTVTMHTKFLHIGNKNKTTDASRLLHKAEGAVEQNNVKRKRSDERAATDRWRSSSGSELQPAGSSRCHGGGVACVRGSSMGAGHCYKGLQAPVCDETALLQRSSSVRGDGGGGPGLGGRNIVS